MGEQLSMLDTMFLELEQADESAHMHIGAALIFDPLPDGGTPDIGQFRDHIRARVGILPRF
ncbi:MAG: wax ester/triacylglycerol synthase domain-containing protein, partial [Solirubrobacteraceae bacterium]